MTDGLLKPSSDFVFANLFGVEKHKRLLICLLNAILNGKPTISSITLLNPQHKKQRKNGKSTTLDIEAVTNDGTIVNIEIQCRRDGNLVTRAVCHQARLIRDELDEGDAYDSSPNIISIWFTDYRETNRQYHTHESLHTFRATPLDDPEVSCEKSRIFIIELPKVDLKKASLNDMFSIWMFFLKNPELIPDEFVQKVPEVHKALEELKVMSMSKEFRAEYRAHIKAENDRRSRETNAKARGIAQGIAQEKKNMAQKLLAKNMDITEISEITDLSFDEIRALKTV
ncbi:MAG: Rpn family recombination-promoting nuclease/putative transposase [Holosporales bacterium]|jgi:predicted transposase/invertase (TIGR01784 family)|nr:Rpn family recombination-promoting nuclease/putative transposase [Holosporales bacterium]